MGKPDQGPEHGLATRYWPASYFGWAGTTYYAGGNCVAWGYGASGVNYAMSAAVIVYGLCGG